MHNITYAHIRITTAIEETSGKAEARVAFRVTSGLRRRLASKLSLFAALCCLGSFAACGDDDVDPVNNSVDSLATTVAINFYINGEFQENLTQWDFDGVGGQPPTFAGGNFIANTRYDFTVALLKRVGQYDTDVHTEIREAADRNQLFYRASGVNLEVSDLDQDRNGKPLGLKGMLQTGEPGMGTLTVTLRSNPRKSAAGVAEGDPTNAGGRTDIEVAFPVTVR